MKVDRDFTPCPVAPGDELFANGIFVFNITKMIDWVRDNSDRLIVEEVAVDDLPEKVSTINKKHLDTVDISKPVVLAEISPGRFNVIDGNHRVEKARKMGVPKIRAYRLTIAQHMAFLTSKAAYVSYVEYVNGKLKDMGRQKT